MTNDFKPAKAGGNQPRLSKEEYAEKKRAEKEKVYQMIDDAAREIVSDPEKFKSFLDTQSRMDRYSAANISDEMFRKKQERSKDYER